MMDRVNEKNEPLLMRVLISLKLEAVAWAMRRYYVPVEKNDLVLEVGSGGNPYPRANILLDAYENSRERFWAPLSADRPTVLGFAEDLPFRDKAFDFVICAHVLEHSRDPIRFLSELQRVAKAGYIEVPDAFFERLNPYRDHRLEITARDNRLIIRKKAEWIHDPVLVELYEDRVKDVLPKELIRRYPFHFHLRYYWNEDIDAEVVNPEVRSNWDDPGDNNSPVQIGKIGRFKEWVRGCLLRLFSQRDRNKTIDVIPLLRCVKCHHSVVATQGQVVCVHCGEKYGIRNGIVVMNEFNE